MPFEVQDEGGRSRLRLHGRWTVAEAAALRGRACATPRARHAARSSSTPRASRRSTLPAPGSCARIEHGDARRRRASSTWLPARARPARFHRPHDAGRAEPPTVRGADRPRSRRLLESVGRATVLAKESALDLLGFIGAVTAGYRPRLRQPQAPSAALGRAPRLRDRPHGRADRLADRLPDRGDRRLHRRPAAAASSAARSSSSTSSRSPCCASSACS